jgi:hypothetical protein
MRTLLLISVLLASTAAQAQPGQTEPMPYEPQGYYAQQPVVQLQLTGEQADLLAQGEISIGRYITGGILAYGVGFGVGHAVQGRWSDQGWIFTVGESASMIAILYGLTQVGHRHGFDEDPYQDNQRDRRGRNYALAGIVGLVGFRIWEVVDAWAAPPFHNRKVRALKRQLGLAPPVYGFYLAPPQNPSASGGVAGLSVSF